MKKLVSVLISLSIMTSIVYAKDKERKILNFKNNKEFSILIGENDTLDAKIFFPSSEPENAVITFTDSISKNKQELFKKISWLFYYFVKTYKVGNTQGKKNLVFYTHQDLKKLPYLYYISIHDLKLLNNRTFDNKEYKLFGKIMPVKLVLKKGKFKVLSKNSKSTKIKQDFINFLNNFHYGLYETQVANDYYKRKPVVNNSSHSYTIERKKYNDDGSSITYFIMCRLGGMINIVSETRTGGCSWDTNAICHHNLQEAIQASCK